MRPAGIVEDSYRERYLRRLHNKGYPATAEQLKKFIKSFYDDLALLKENKEQLRRVIQKFTCRSIKVCSFSFKWYSFLFRIALYRVP